MHVRDGHHTVVTSEPSRPFTFGVFKLSCTCTGGTKYLMLRFAAEQGGTTSLETILLRRLLRWLGHVIRMPGNRFPRRLLYSELSCGRRSLGGQKKPFKDLIKSSLSKCGIPFDRLEELAGDREEWRAVCDKGLATFEQQHIDVAVAKRMRRHQQRNPPSTRRQGMYSMWPCLRLSLWIKEPHAPTKGNALSSVIVEPTDN